MTKDLMGAAEYALFRQQLLWIPIICSVLIGGLGAFFQWYTQTPRYQHDSYSGDKTLEAVPPAVKHALVVDDNPANRLIIDKLLQEEGVTVTQAINGSHAIELFECEKYSAIFMDIEMEGTDGLTATRHIRDMEQSQQAMRTPIIAVSAHNEQEKQFQALLAGFDDYMVKPINSQRMQHSLQRWCHNTEVAKGQTSIPEQTSLQEQPPAKAIQAQQQVATEAHLEKINKVVDIQQSLEYSHQNYELAKDMLKLLVSMIQQEKDSLIKHYRNKDWQALSLLTHKLHGGSCYCGVPKLQHYCEIADKMLQKQHYDNIDSAIENLLAAMDEILIWETQFDIDVIFDH